MAKIAKRQMIILIVTAVVVLYGIFDFFMGSPVKTAPLSLGKQSSELKKFATDITAGIGKDTLSLQEVYAIGRAEGEWLRDPFYDRKSYKEWLKSKETAKATADTKKITFNYSGYMEFGDKRIAIINGVEYRAGEALEVKGYVLRALSPGKAIIENKRDGIRLEVPIQD